MAHTFSIFFNPLLFSLVIVVIGAGDQVGYKSDETWREAALGDQIHLHFFDDNDLIVLSKIMLISGE
jgi:hypothetical protein